MKHSSPHDIKSFFMSIALKEAQKMIGCVYPNPSVGCVIEKNGNILSVGVTQSGGRPHAEQNAISKVKEKYKLMNSNFYITMEPCTHYGNTGPCINEILKYSPKNIYIGIKDPDKRVYGKILDILKKSNINCEYGIKKNDIFKLNEGYIFSKILNRPYITAKIACSIDSKIATASMESKWITCNESRSYVQKLRKINDAIITGGKTILYDNPRLDYRINNANDSMFSPEKIIIANKNLQKICSNKDLKIFKNKKPWLITAVDNIKNNNFLKQERDLFEHIIECNLLKNGNLDLTEAMKKISSLGITSALVESGSYTITEFIKQQLIDELIIVRGSIIIGKEGKDMIENLAIDNLTECLRLSVDYQKNIKNDIVEIYKTQPTIEIEKALLKKV